MVSETAPKCERLVARDVECDRPAAHRVWVGKRTYRLCEQHAQDAADMGYRVVAGFGVIEPPEFVMPGPRR